MLASTALAAQPAPVAAHAAATANGGKPPKIGVCFGSGSLHGYAHVGAFRAFDAPGLKPDVITGTSLRAIAGVLWAAGL